MLTALNLGNFKAFAETQNIPIRPLTLIFGANSAGKSSILHGLLFAREALESGNLDVRKPGLAGNSLDLGGFKQFIHRHQPQTSFTWGAEFQLPKELELFSLANSKPWSIGLSVEIAESPLSVAPVQMDISVMGNLFLRLSLRSPVFSNSPEIFSQRGARRNASNTFWGKAHRFLIQDLDLDHALAHLHFFPTLEKLMGRKLGRTEQLKIRNIVEELTGEITALVEKFIPKEAELVCPDDHFSESFRQAYPQLVKWMENGKNWRDLPKLPPLGKMPKTHYKGIIGVVLFATLDEILRKTYNLMTDALGGLTYLGPLRFYPERHSAFSEKRDDWYSQGEYAWDCLCSNDELREQANAWLKTMGIHYHVNPRIWHAKKTGRMPPDSRKELALLDIRNGTVVSPRDIGIGVSQLLPIIVTACGGQNQIHAIEQPEIHVHPALQAELGDLFIESALGERKNTFLLETHSEHLLLRIMRRMRETHLKTLPKGCTPITQNEVSILFVETDGARSIVREMPLNDLGELVKAWPGGFFEEGYRELFH